MVKVKVNSIHYTCNCMCPALLTWLGVSTGPPLCTRYLTMVSDCSVSFKCRQVYPCCNFENEKTFSCSYDVHGVQYMWCDHLLNSRPLSVLLNAPHVNKATGMQVSWLGLHHTTHNTCSALTLSSVDTLAPFSTRI